MAAHKKPVDWSLLHGLLSYDASGEYCAYKLGMSKETLDRAIKKQHNMLFSEYKALFVEETAKRLKEIMINKALNGNVTCLIFSLKNLSAWSDKVEHGFDKDKKDIVLRYSLDDKKSDGNE